MQPNTTPTYEPGLTSITRIIDGIRVHVKLPHPLPDGFRLDRVCTGDKITAALAAEDASGQLSFILRSGHAEAAKLEPGSSAEPRIVFRVASDDTQFFVSAFLVQRDGAPKSYLFIFGHPGIKARPGITKMERTVFCCDLLQGVVKSLLTELSRKGGVC
jgi:hypothetical protein